MGSMWKDMTHEERLAHSRKWDTDWHKQFDEPEGSLSLGGSPAPQVSGLAQALNLQPIQQSDAFVNQIGDDIRATGTASNQRLYSSDPAAQPSYNQAEVNRIADEIRNSGHQLQQGNKFFDTGNPDINEALYGPDISRNLGTDGEQGFRTPRQFDTEFSDYLGAAVREGVPALALGAATGGGGLFGALNAVGQGAASIPGILSSANTIYNFGQDVNDRANEDSPPDIAWQTVDPTDILGDVQVQVPNFQLPNEGGGGGGEMSGGQTSEPAAPVSIDGGRDPGEIDPERPWLYTGNGNFVNILTGESTTQDQSENAVAGEYYSIGDEAVSEEPGNNDFTLGGLIANDVGDLSVESQVAQVADPSWSPSVTITNNNDGSLPGVNLPGEGNNVVRGDLLQGGGTDNGGTQGGGNGTVGEGTGTNGTGNGTNGTGNGNGGNGTDTPISDEFFGKGSESDFSDLFPYTTINPSRPAQLGGMMDYVAALIGGRR